MAPYEHLKPEYVGNRNWGAPAIYYATVTEADRQIGRLLHRLDELGLAENTVVIFSADNGPEDILIRNASHSSAGSSGPFRGRKRSLYEGGIRVPFIIRWPGGGAPAGRIDNETPLCAVDLLPTFCELAGVSIPNDLPLDGESMRDVLQRDSRAHQTPLMWEWRFSIAGHPLNKSPMLALRQGDWKLLLNPGRDQPHQARAELYHIPTDPMELNNLAEARPQLIDAMRQELLAWHASLPPGPVDPNAGSNAYPWPGR